ncbi:hypothetical protein L1987_22068 [Smallanthus sonchifolius]|uniref:Uncharacterized protein n=1 Tax=Smallanthus sonchifolius TaxID=185202 RepID=A0ACB9IES2_9ASTR|nr:hypothetical protein L1987_22068 [Smallanthus sonchifolius]
MGNESQKADSGALELHKVFELIAEGENIPVHFDKELKLLKERKIERPTLITQDRLVFYLGSSSLRNRWPYFSSKEIGMH